MRWASPPKPNVPVPVAKAMTTVRPDDGWDGDWFLRAYDFFGNKVWLARM